MALESRFRWHALVGAGLVFRLVHFGAPPESHLSAITTLNINTKWKLKPRESTWLSIVVLLADEPEVASDFREGFGVSEVNTFDLVSEFFRNLNRQLTCDIVVAIVEVGSLLTFSS